MSALTGKTPGAPDNTYLSLLRLETPLSGSLQTVLDGAGSSTPIQVSSTGVSIAGLSLTSALAVASGGTGATTSAANLVFAGPVTGSAADPSFRSLVVADLPDLSTVYQPIDGDLTAIAALSSTGFAKRTGANTWSVGSLTTGDIPDLSGVYQPLDGDLTAIAALSTTGVVKRTASNTWTAGALIVGDIPDLSGVYQPLDGDLTAIAALSTTGFAKRTGANTWTAAALIAGDIPDLSATYQPLDGDLTAVAALSGTGIARRTGANTWSTGTTVSIAEGGTGQITAAAAVTALLGALTNTNGDMLYITGGVPFWAAPPAVGGGGTVTSVDLAVPAIFSVSGNPITSSGTITVGLATQTANRVWAGPTTGSAATPTFRALVAADIPDLSATYQPLDGDLTAIAALSSTGFAKRTGSNTWSVGALVAGDIPDLSATYQPLDADLTAIAALSSTGIARRTASNTWSVGTTVSIAEGGTGQITAAAAFDALAPLTTLGDIVYFSTTGARLAGNITATRKFLRQTGTGTISAAPAWDTVTSTDVGLGSVENTALSTWAGTTNITTLGTIVTGTWSGTTIAVNKGGTGATSFTAGSLLYGNGTSAVSVNSSLSYNPTTNNLYVGSAANATVFDQIFVSGSENTGNGVCLTVENTASGASFALFRMRTNGGVRGVFFGHDTTSFAQYGIVNGIAMRPGQSNADLALSHGATVSGGQPGPGFILKSDSRIVMGDSTGWVTGAPGAAQVTINSLSATGDHTLLLQGMTSQTGNLLRLQTVTPTVVMTVSIAGDMTLAPIVRTTGSPTLLTVTGPAHTTLTASVEATDINFNLARTVQYAAGALTTQRAVRVQAPTYAFASSSTLTTAVTWDISGAPAAGTNATITNQIALRVSAGIAAGVPLQLVGAASQTGNMFEVRTSGGTAVNTINGSGDQTSAPSIRTTGSPTLFLVTGPAHTTLTASVEAIDVNFNLARTVQYSTGALTTQRAFVIQAPTYGFVASSTLATAVTLDVTSAPVAGTNATITTQITARLSAGIASGIPLVLRGFTSQTKDLFQIRDVSETVLNNCDKDGYMFPLAGGFNLGVGSAVVTGTNLTCVVQIPANCKIVKVFAYAKTGPTGADLIFDINYHATNDASATTIWSTQANRVKIVAGAKTGSQTSFDTTTLAEGGLLTIDVDQVGSTIAGQDITVTVWCRCKESR